MSSTLPSRPTVVIEELSEGSIVNSTGSNTEESVLELDFNTE